MPDTLTDTRQCAATSKRTGERCRGYRAEGSDKCVMHLRGEEIRTRGLQESARVRRERVERRKMTSKDAVAQALEAHADELVKSVIQAAKAGDWKATAWLFERVHGKPKETVETQTSSKPVSEWTAEELDAALASLSEDAAARLASE